MPFRKQVSDGILFLLSHRNEDDGIPATVLGDESGCWTTAEAVDVLLRSPDLPKERIPDIRRMIEFLLKNQIPGKGWPMAPEGNYVSTMATGHALAALSLAEKIFYENEELMSRCKKARTEAFEWIRQHVNPNEGWGVEPEKDRGKETRVISTCYALRGYIAMGLNYDNSKDVRKVIDYLIDIVNKDSGWGGRKGAPTDPDNTSRVVSILIQSGKFKHNDPMVKRGLKYILNSRKNWRMDTEAYASKGAPGQVFFHSNTPVDVLEALISCKYYGTETHDLIKFLIGSQEEDGRWYLCDELKKDTSICTWSTSEAIEVLDFAQKGYFENLFNQQAYKSPLKMKLALLAISVIGFLEFLQIVHAYDSAYSWWTRLSEGWQQVIVGYTIFSIVIGLLVSFLYDKIRTFGEKRKKSGKA